MSGDESSSPRDRSSPGLPPSSGKSPVVRLDNVSLRYGNTVALRALTLDFPAGCMVGLIGPDGVGKSSLFSLVSGAHAIQTGRVEVLDGDMADVRHRRAICPRVAYMPQGLGKNLYPTLSVFENTDFFGRLFGQDETERRQRIDNLLQSTGLAPFRDRPAGKLSGGMKQKLGLCCALIHDPDLLILDEPTTGVDPLSRRQFWDLIDRIRVGQPDMSVLVATAYMEEAARFDWLVAMDAGQVLATGSPQALLDKTGEPSLEQAFIALLPEEARRDHKPVVIPPRAAEEHGDVAIEAKDLTMRFGDFVAVDHVGFRIERGEIFGFLGSNGCGKTTTMKMLTGLLPPTEGEAWLFGEPVDPKDLKTRQRVGYMSQAFSLYTELTVGQNLLLHGRLFHVPEEQIPERIDTLARRFGLEDAMDAMPDALPMGQRQRLSLAVALIHRPDLLILDEPTSGVDPVARDAFWEILAHLSRRDKVTIFISTHFMNEAERCDRISLMHAGQVLVSDKPAALPGKRGVKTLEDAFISYLEDAEAKNASAGQSSTQPARAAQLNPPAAAGDATGIPTAVHPGETATVATPASAQSQPVAPPPAPRRHHFFDVRRMLSYSHREALELLRDPVRGTMALLGSVILLFIMGYGINMDVEDVSFAVLDRDHTTTSRDYALNLGGSRYFIPHGPISDYEELDRRMRSGELSLVIEIPPNFARDLRRGAPVAVAAWVDGAMPQRGETVQGYVRGMHNLWLDDDTFYKLGQPSPKLINIETRFRYNPDVKSLVALVPAVIPLLLILIPTMLTSLSVVREKEMGSIVNLYVTPVTRLEFLIGKQLPYIILGMINYLLLVLLAVTVFGIPFKGSFFALTLAALLYVAATTAMGLLISTFMRSQIAAIFGSAVLTMLPAQKFSGMLDPVSSLEGGAALISDVYPMAHFLTISRGAFSKALGVTDLPHPFLALVLTAPILLALSALFLKKQES